MTSTLKGINKKKNLAQGGRGGGGLGGRGDNHLGYSPIMLELMKGVGDNPSWDTNRLSLK